MHEALQNTSSTQASAADMIPTLTDLQVQADNLFYS